MVAATGILEVFYYIPTPTEAALSVQTISYLVPFGGLVRNLHYWSAQLLVLVMGVHLARVVFTGAYAPPRRFNHLLGPGYFWSSRFCWISPATCCDGTKAFSGRWSWAPILSARSRLWGQLFTSLVAGGAELGSGDAALVRFYAWHIFGLALLFVSPERLAPIPRSPGWRHCGSPTGSAHWITHASPATNSCGAKSSPRCSLPLHS